MAQSNINCSKSTYIRPNDNVTHLGSAVKTSGLIGNNYDVNQVSTAVLQFAIPAALRYKRFVSAKLVCYISPSSSSSAFGAGCWIAPYMCGDVLATLTYANRNAGGIVGESIQVEKLDVYAPATAGWRTFDISPLFAGNIYNNASFTCFVNACPGQPFLNYEATIDGAGSAHVPYLVVTYEDVPQLPPTPAYPANVYVNENTDILFSWTFNSSTQAKQSAAVLEYKLASAATYTVVNLTQEGYSYKLTGGLPQGAYEWRVKVTNDAGETSGYSTVVQFNVIGKPAAPVINTPTNETRTSIKWNSTDQNAYEIILTAADGTVLVNEVVSSAETEYKPNMFLANGSYTVGIRTKNSTGMFSEFAYKAFLINATGPAKPTAVIRQDAAKVYLSFTNAQNMEIAIMRQEKGKAEECIAILSGLETEYVDYTLKSGTEYSYFVRAFNTGYTDSDKQYIYVKLQGMQLICDELEVNLTTSEERFQAYSETVSRETAMLKFSGREFPLVERGEFTDQKISRMYFAGENERKILSEMVKRPMAYYRDSKGNAFPCAVVGVSFKQYMDSGYNASIDLIRIDTEEVKVNV